jgi:hypothetical protein
MLAARDSYAEATSTRGSRPTVRVKRSLNMFPFRNVGGGRQDDLHADPNKDMTPGENGGEQTHTLSVVGLLAVQGVDC